MKIIIFEKRLTNWLFIITAILSILSIFFQIFKYFLGQERVFGLTYFFNIDEEWNLPTFFSVFLFIFIAIILYIIFKTLHREKKKNTFYWLSLSILFILLGIDESVAIHERFIEPLRDWLNLSGIFYYGWVILGILFIFVIFILYIKFLKSLTPKIRNWIILAGIVYIAGALGMEMVGGWYFEIHDNDFLYQIIVTVEEVLEILGLIIFIKTLLSHLKLILSKSNNILKMEIA